MSSENTLWRKGRCLLSWQEYLFVFDSPRLAPTPSRDRGSRLLYHGQHTSNSSAKDIVRVGVGPSIIGKTLSASHTVPVIMHRVGMEPAMLGARDRLHRKDSVEEKHDRGR